MHISGKSRVGNQGNSKRKFKEIWGKPLKWGKSDTDGGAAICCYNTYEAQGELNCKEIKCVIATSIKFTIW